MDIAIVISLIVTGLIKPMVVLLVVALLWLCVRKKSAALQHFILCMGVIGVLCLPLLASFLPVIEGRLSSVISSLILAPQSWITSYVAEAATSIESKYLLLAVGVYLFPASWMLFYLALGIYGLSRLTKHSRVIQDELITKQIDTLRELFDVSRPVKIISSADVETPQTWGIFNPVIMLPREALLWEEEKQLSVFIHEMAHIARWDWLTTLLIKITCACFWFLLPIWWVAQKIYQQAEIACDDYVYKLRDKHLVYAKSLLAIASESRINCESTDALQMRGQSPIYVRIMSVLDKQRPHHPVPVETAQYWLIVGGLLLILLACVQILPMHYQIQTGAKHYLQWREKESASELMSLPERTEQFSWALMQQLKPNVQIAPAPFEALEQVVVQVSKPEKHELQESQMHLDFYKTSMAIPSINIQGYLPLNMVAPEYPRQALIKGIEGWVEVIFSIDTDGRIVEPKINARHPSRIFDHSVLTALKKSRYRPQLLDGQPVIVQGVTELFRFNLISPSESSSEERESAARIPIDRHRR